MSTRFVLPFADVGSGITPSSGAKLFFTITGTNTDLDTFSDAGLTTANANPVVADSTGVFSDIFLGNTSSYKVILKDKNNVQIWEADPVSPSEIITQADSVSDAMARDLTLIDSVITVSYYGSWADTSAGPRGGGTYYRDGTTGSASTVYTNQNGFYDSTGEGFKLVLVEPVNVEDFGIIGDGTDETSEIAGMLSITGEKEILVPDGFTIGITSSVESFTGNGSTTIFTPVATIDIARTSVTVGGQLLDGSFGAEGAAGSGSYTNKSSQVEFWTAPINGASIIIATSVIGFQGRIHMEGDSTFQLLNAGATGPTLHKGCDRFSITSEDDNQTGIVINGVNKTYNYIISTDFANANLMLARPNIAGAYYLDLGVVNVDNENRDGNLALDFGGDFPRTNSNIVTTMTMKGRHTRKCRIHGNNNIIQQSDVLATNSFVSTVNDFIIYGCCNQILANYDEAADGGIRPGIVEFSKEIDGTSPSNTVRGAVGNKFFNKISTCDRGAFSELFIDTNGLNHFEASVGTLLGDLDGANSKPQRNLWQNHEFTPNSSGLPYGCAAVNNGSFTRTATSTLSKDFSVDKANPILGRNAMTLTADGVGFCGIQMYVSANSTSTDSTVNMPENQVRHMVQREDLRGQQITVGAWVYFEGTQAQLDAAGNVGIGVSQSRDNKLKLANKWTFITQSQIYLDDYSFSGLGNRVNFQIRTNTTVASGAKLHISAVQFCVGETASPSGLPATLETAVGGVLYGDLHMAESDSAENTPLLDLNGVWIWGVAGTIRIATTRPTDLATDGAPLLT